jgi:hypothetical protein
MYMNIGITMVMIKTIKIMITAVVHTITVINMTAGEVYHFIFAYYLYIIYMCIYIYIYICGLYGEDYSIFFQINIYSNKHHHYHNSMYDVYNGHHNGNGFSNGNNLHSIRYVYICISLYVYLSIYACLSMNIRMCIYVYMHECVYDMYDVYNGHHNGNRFSKGNNLHSICVYIRVYICVRLSKRLYMYLNL